MQRGDGPCSVPALEFDAEIAQAHRRFRSLGSTVDQPPLFQGRLQHAAINPRVSKHQFKRDVLARIILVKGYRFLFHDVGELWLNIVRIYERKLVDLSKPRIYRKESPNSEETSEHLLKVHIT
jgi:hypothetical protein